MVVESQIRALIDYLEGHRDLALGHIGRTMEGRSLAKRRWAEIAQILNAISPDCPNKSATEWRSFYNEYKSKLMKKIKINKREMVATGGGPPKKIIFTPLQERLYDILGRDIGEPLAGVRHNPIAHTITLPAEVEVAASTCTGTSEPALSFSLLENYVEDNEINIINIPTMPVEPVLGEDVEISPEQEPAPSSAKRRRQKSTRRNTQECNYTVLQAAQERLEKIEAQNAEATLEHARATDRLAAAIEKIGETITLAVHTFSASSTKKRRCRIIVSSDSESDS